MLAVTGCGGGGGEKKPATPADAVHEAAEAARGDTLRVKVSRHGTVEGLGVYGFEGEAIVRDDDASAKGMIDGPKDEEPFELRVRGEDVWLTANERDKLPPGKRWVRVPGPRSIERGLAPYYLVDVFAKARDVKRVGTDHYRAVVEATDLPHVPEITFMSGRGDRIPVDLYVADGRPKRLRLEYDAGPSDMFADFVVLGVSSAPPEGTPPESETVDQRD